MSAVLTLARPAPSLAPALAAPGRGSLAVVRHGDRTVVTRAYATSPLRLLMPANHGHAAWVYTSTYGGGLVDGDAIALEIAVGVGASALVSTQASTKVYRSPRGTRAELQARVEGGGLLVVVPDPVVGFAQSRYRQAQRFDLANDASLVLLDWLTSGRRASGERWAFEEYVGTLIASVAGTLVVHDALALRAADGDIAERLGRFDVLAVVLLLGPAVRTEAAAIVATMQEAPVPRRPGQLMSVAALGEAGCLVRIAGTSVEEVGRTVRALLAFLPSMLGDNPWTRKC